MASFYIKIRDKKEEKTSNANNQLCSFFCKMSVGGGLITQTFFFSFLNYLFNILFQGDGKKNGKTYTQ